MKKVIPTICLLLTAFIFGFLSYIYFPSHDDPKLQEPEFRILTARCSAKHIYWEISCRDSRFIATSCDAVAWTGEKTYSGKHTEEWMLEAPSAEQAAVLLSEELDKPGNKHDGHTTFDSGIQECKPPIKENK